MKRTSSSEFLEALRARPRKERKAIAMGAAGSITGVIAFIWMVNMYADIGAASSEITANVSSAVQQSSDALRNEEILASYRDGLQATEPQESFVPSIEKEATAVFEEFTAILQEQQEVRAVTEEMIQQQNSVQIPQQPYNQSGGEQNVNVLQ